MSPHYLLQTSTAPLVKALPHKLKVENGDRSLLRVHKTILFLAWWVGFSLCVANNASAQNKSKTDASLGMLLDGGAIPFIYGSGIWSLVSNYFFEPPTKPRFFSANEGGKERKGDTVPEWVMLGAGVGSVAGIAWSGNDSRWFHTKGLLQAMLTSSALTGTAKFLVGRHRPHYNPSNRNPEHRKSFFSGHSSQSFVLAMYGSLYLHEHVFPDLTKSTNTEWWQFLSYGALFGLATYVPYSRIKDNRHHFTDVLTGAVVGSGLALLFYSWQNNRFESAVSDDQTSHEQMQSTSSTPFMLQGFWAF